MQKKLQTHFIRFQYICKYHLSAVMIGFLNKLHRYITHKNNTEEIVLRNTKHETLIKHLTGSNPEICKLNNRTLTQKKRIRKHTQTQTHTFYLCTCNHSRTHMVYSSATDLPERSIPLAPRNKGATPLTP